jgi:hypothetical protein
MMNDDIAICPKDPMSRLERTNAALRHPCGRTGTTAIPYCWPS